MEHNMENMEHNIDMEHKDIYTSPEVKVTELRCLQLLCESNWTTESTDVEDECN